MTHNGGSGGSGGYSSSPSMRDSYSGGGHSADDGHNHGRDSYASPQQEYG